MHLVNKRLFIFLLLHLKGQEKLSSVCLKILMDFYRIYDEFQSFEYYVYSGIKVWENSLQHMLTITKTQVSNANMLVVLL